MSAQPFDGVPELAITDQDEAIVALLRRLQAAALTHTEAARALFVSLVKEGELFAQTEEGQQWSERLGRSALLQRALIVWQSATLWIAEEPGDAAAPSALIDAVAAAAASPRREALVERLFTQSAESGQSGQSGEDP